MISLQRCIKQIIEIKKKHNLTPEQNRYVDKQVRNLLDLSIPKRAKKLPVYLTPPEIYHFLEVAWNKSTTHGLLCDFLIKTGLRINEARNVDIRDFQDNNQLKVVHAKFNKERYVPITNSLQQKIKLYRGPRTQGYLFINQNKRQYSKRRLQQLVCEVITESNIMKPGLSTHSLRHTFACLCLAKGMRLEDIKLLMGHSSIKTTEIYAKLELGAIKEKYLRLMGDA